MGNARQPERSGSNGFTQWAGLYMSGVLLLVFVLAHIWAVHYASDVTAEGFTFTSVSTRMQSPLYSFLILGLLVTALFHGLIGLHRFIADLAICGRKALRVVGAVITAAGVVGFVYGLLIYRAFVS